MLKVIDKINVILAERAELRKEIIEAEKMLFYVGKLLLTSIIAVIAIYFDKKIIEDIETRNQLLIILSQLEFILGLIASIILIGMQATAGYIAVLEKKINKLSKEDLAIWESDIARNYLFNIKKSFFKTTLMLFAIGIIIFVLINFLSNIRNMTYGVLVIIEIITIIWLLKKSFDDRKEIESHTENVFIKHEQPDEQKEQTN